MRPEDVPADLVEKATKAMAPGYPPSRAQERAARSALAAVLPDHRKQVIEEAATAVERSNSRRFPGRGWDFQYAAALRNYAHEDE